MQIKGIFWKLFHLLITPSINKTSTSINYSLNQQNFSIYQLLFKLTENNSYSFLLLINHKRFNDSEEYMFFIYIKYKLPLSLDSFSKANFIYCSRYTGCFKIKYTIWNQYNFHSIIDTNLKQKPFEKRGFKFFIWCIT